MDNRYYFDRLEDSKVVIENNEAQHLSRVRRCSVGDIVMAFNGDGYDYRVKIDSIHKDKVICSIIDKTINRAFTDTDITVYLAMIKNEALCTAIDNLAELNVKHVKLFASDFTIAMVDEKKLEKLRNIAIQASKQSERADIMDISLISKLNIKDDIMKYKNRFFAYENSTNKLDSFSGDFAVIIGPEGGFSMEENEYFSSFTENISLSKTILRAEVACISAVSSLKAVRSES